MYVCLCSWLLTWPCKAAPHLCVALHHHHHPARLQARTAHLAKVNGALHFLKRGAVAMVPLGVMVVNTIGEWRF
jgi:hypothetical protein